jgi:D-alanyl-D-alanine carboxypeptidase
MGITQRIVLVLTAAAAVVATAAAAPGAEQEYRSVQRMLDRMTTVDGLPGAQAVVVGRGRSVTLTSGVGDRGTGAPMPGAGGHVRGASNVKPMLATVILQLVADGRVALDAPVRTYLPGIIPPKAGDDGRITVRHLLQHTSGLHNHSEELPIGAGFTPFKHYTRKDLLDLGFSKGPDFRPGEDWHYSNTGYVVLGMIVEQVTGHSWRDEIRSRIFDRLGMTESYFPADYDYGLRRPHARGYLQLPIPGGGIATADVTEFDPSSTDANGSGVTTPRDLLRFYQALLSGRLVRADLLTEMQRARPVPDPRLKLSYGLGLGKMELPCGGEAWGHGGNLEGFQTLTGVVVDRNGRIVKAANVFTNTTFTEANIAGGMDQFTTLFTALCANG